MVTVLHLGERKKLQWKENLARNHLLLLPVYLCAVNIGEVDELEPVS